MNLPFAGPLAIAPEELARLEAQLEAAQRFGSTMPADRAPHAIRRESSGGRGAIALVPLSGFLTQKSSLFSLFGLGSSVEAFAEAVVDGLRDPGVSAVVMDIDSPGGEVFGVQEAAQRIRAARGRKPLIAIANPIAASAAYQLASQADVLVATPSALVGSIGAFTVHVDASGALAQQGLRVTLIAFGRRKAEEATLGPLGEEARAAIQQRVDDFGETFLRDVAAGRGVPVSTVRTGYGEGAIFTARRALAAGLVDLIGTREQLLRQIASGIPVERKRSFDLAALRAHAIVAGVSLEREFDPALLSAHYIVAGIPIPKSLRESKNAQARR